MEEEVIDDSPMPEVEPVKPKDPVVVPTTPKDTTPEQPKTPDAIDDHQNESQDDVTPETSEEIADDRYSASPIMDLILNIMSVIGFLVSFELMQFFKANILSLFKH